MSLEENIDKQIELLKFLVKVNQLRKEEELGQEIDPYRQLDELPKEEIARNDEEQSDLLYYEPSNTISYAQSLPYSIGVDTNTHEISARSIKSSAESIIPNQSIFKWSLYKKLEPNVNITAFYGTTNYIAIGIISNSHILKIYKKNANVEFLSEFGKVTCIHILNTQLIAGYEKGHIAVYDLTKMSLLKLISPIEETEMISNRQQSIQSARIKTSK